MTHNLAPFMKRFFSHYLPVQKGLSVNTISSYRDAIKLLLCYSGDNLKKSVDTLIVEDITESLVLNFLDHIESNRGCIARDFPASLQNLKKFAATFLGFQQAGLLSRCQQLDFGLAFPGSARAASRQETTQRLRRVSVSQ